MQYGFRTAMWMMILLIIAVAGCPQKQGGNAQSLPPGQSSGDAADTQAGSSRDEPVDDMDLGWIGDAVDFSCTTFDGEQFRASESGKPVIVNFWAAW